LVKELNRNVDIFFRIKLEAKLSKDEILVHHIAVGGDTNRGTAESAVAGVSPATFNFLNKNANNLLFGLSGRFQNKVRVALYPHLIKVFRY